MRISVGTEGISGAAGEGAQRVTHASERPFGFRAVVTWPLIALRRAFKSRVWPGRAKSGGPGRRLLGAAIFLLSAAALMLWWQARPNRRVDYENYQLVWSGKTFLGTRSGMTRAEVLRILGSPSGTFEWIGAGWKRPEIWQITSHEAISDPPPDATVWEGASGAIVVCFDHSERVALVWWLEPSGQKPGVIEVIWRRLGSKWGAWFR